MRGLPRDLTPEARWVILCMALAVPLAMLIGFVAVMLQASGR